MGLPFRFALIQLPGSIDLTTPPTYTDIYNETVGKQGDVPALFDPHMTEAGKLLDAFAIDGSLTAPDPDLTSAQQIYGQADPTQLDAHIAAYEATKPAGDAIVANAQGLSAPTIGPLQTMWTYPTTTVITPPSGSGVQVPGQVTAGDPPFTWTTTQSFSDIGTGGVYGVRLAQSSDIFTGVQLVKVGPFYNVTAPDGHTQWRTQDATIAVSVNPTTAGSYEVGLIFSVDYPRLGNAVPRRIALQIHPKP